MKKVVILFLIVLCCLRGYSQYFEWSRSLMNVGSSQAASIYPLSIDLDYEGNFLFTADSKPCLLCTHETHIIKKGYPRNWEILGFSFFLSGNTHKMFGDSAGNAFYFGSINNTMNIGGVSTTIYSANDTLAFIKFDTAGVALWAQNRVIKNAYVDYLGNSYLIDDSNKVTFYNPQGQQQWQRYFYGTSIYADSSYNYYQCHNSAITKFDSSGVIQWVLNTATSNFYFTRMCTRLFVPTGILYSEIDLSNGSVLNTTAYGGQAYDSKGNYYSSNYTSKSDSTGLLWTYTLKNNNQNISFPGYMDKDDNIYNASNLNTGYGGTKLDLWIPPSLYVYNDPLIYYGYSASIFAYKISPYDTITNGTITTGNVTAICAGGKLTVPFTYNKYFVQYYNPGFSVQLSDSSGSFAQPVVIGTGNRSPIECNIPFFNLQGTNYHVRVVSNTIPQIVGSANALPLTAYTAAPPQIGFSNFNLNSWTSCTPFTMFVAPVGNYTCVWYKNTYQNQSVYTYFTSGNPIVPFVTDDDYNVYVTDITSGCKYTLHASNVYGTPNNYMSFYSLPTSVCSNDGPVKLPKATQHGAFSGNGVYNDWFYPDSVATGIAPITYTTFDTVPCYNPDTTLFINVNTCINPLKTISVNQGLKNKFCVGDSLIVDFVADTSFFPAGTKFYLQLSYQNGSFPGLPNNIIDSAYSSPFHTAAQIIYASGNQYRLRVVTASPVTIGTLNTDGFISIYSKPVIRNFYTPQNINTNCGYGINQLHALVNGSVYTWHHDSVTFVDSSLTGLGTVYTDTSSSFLALNNGYYWVDITNEGGCVATTDSIFITDSIQLVNASINPISVFKCPLDTAYLALQTDSLNIVSWTLNTSLITTPNPYLITAILPGTYSAAVTNNIGCKVTVSSFVSQYNLPAVTLSSAKTYVCNGDSTYISFTNPGGYSNMSWYKNGVLQATNNNNYFYAQDSGSYYASYYWGQTCIMFTDTITLQLKQKPLAIFAHDSLYYCYNASAINIQASCNITGSSLYAWHLQSGSYVSNTNTSIGTLNLNTNPGLSNGVYTLSVANECPSGGQDTLRVFPYTMQPVTLNSLDSTTFCIGDSALLATSYAGGSNYVWLHNGTDTLSNDTLTSLYVFSQGSYTVTITDSVCNNVSNAVIITTPCTTGLMDAMSAGKVYAVPNPVIGSVVLHVPLSLKNERLELYEATGKLLLSSTVKNTETIISLHDYLPGIYFLKINETYLQLVKLKE